MISLSLSLLNFLVLQRDKWLHCDTKKPEKTPFEFELKPIIRGSLNSFSIEFQEVESEKQWLKGPLGFCISVLSRTSIKFCAIKIKSER